MPAAPTPPDGTQLVRASAADTARIALRVLLPTLSVGVIVRRPRAMALAQRFQLDRSAIRLMADLRSRYGSGPLRLRIPGRELAMVLDPAHVREILHDNPQRFTPANREKRAALSHFQPRGVLISRGRERARRRQFHEDVLQIDQPVHELGPRIVEVGRQEGRLIADRAASANDLDWDTFAAGWWRAVRRAVLGDGARDDDRLISLLNELRADANWAFLRPRRQCRYRQFQQRLHAHLRKAEPASLATSIADRDERDVDPDEQVPHWLFAFDAAGMVAFRTLALLATHPEHARAVRDEITAADGETPLLPYLRACLLDTVRLWPTTPALLRDSVTPTQWEKRTLPAGAGLFVFTPFFHRDETTVRNAHRFSPAGWMDDASSLNPALVPFSDGPGRCPGRNLVLLLSSSLLATLLQQQRFTLLNNTILDPDRPLPATLDNFGLHFRADPSQADTRTRTR